MTATPSDFVIGGGGVRLRIERNGGPGELPVIFVHGWLQSRLVWEPSFRGLLAQRSPLIRFDLRGHGESDVPLDDAAYQNPALWAEDLAAVVAAADAPRVVIVAWSYGALLVCDYVRNYGLEHLAGVVFVGALAIKGIDRNAPFAGPALIEHLAAIGSNDAAAANRATVAFVHASTAQPLNAHAVYEMLGYAVTVPPSVRAAMQRRRLENHEIVAGLDIPVLVVHGRDDRVVNFASGTYLAQTAPRAQLHAYDGVGHLPFRENPGRFERDVDAFLTEIALG